MPFALIEAHRSHARLLLLHVLGAGSGIVSDPVGMPYYDAAGAIDFTVKTLEPWRMMARTQDLPCDSVVREGQPAQQILAAARQFRADRLLLGTRSRSKVSKLLLGSVAEQVLRSVNLPVITVGPEAHLKAASTYSQGVVLHATTLRETSSPSAVLACNVASAQNAKLVLLHVLPPVEDTARPQFPTGLESTAMRELRSLAADIRAAGQCSTQIETRIAHGHPAIEILAASVDLGAELIVLGSTSRSIIHNLTHDRIVYRVLAHARCPVMTLRDSEESSAPVALQQDRISL
jgi:nucleotide-binding universal stress UspA family protein